MSKRYTSIVEVSNALATIDGNELDWQYSIAADGTQSWRKTAAEKELSIVVDPAGTAVATKKTAKSESKITAYCTKNITDKQLRTFLKEH
ncbi:hypothetical protein [Cupriavidus pauculus]|uniref:hypothetical protein n=1 Tax=Cupriavidus pauculus TaxID=82633 RepID=UPI001FD2F951|nr:hypothetical protein [Cupriavidus pauculus]